MSALRFRENMKYENQKFDQKSENLKMDKIWIFRSNAFHGPPKFTKASDWLKNSFHLFRMVIVIGEFINIWPTFKCVKLPIAMLLDLRWNPPPPNLWHRKKTKNFLGLNCQQKYNQFGITIQCLPSFFLACWWFVTISIYKTIVNFFLDISR